MASSRFDKMTAALAAKEATNPRALAAHIGRKKYGKEAFSALQKAGQTAKRSATQAGVFFRSAPDLEIQRGGDGRTIVGYAVPFNRAVQIDASLIEAFDPHSFDHQIDRMARVGYWHGHQAEGGKHVGRIMRAEPQPAGLYTESRVSKTQAGDELLEMVKDGSVPDQSVGFAIGPNDTQIRSGVAVRMKATLTELAAVPEGAYGDGAAIAGVRRMGGTTTEDLAVTAAVTAELSNLDRSRRALASLPVLDF
jgi:hypothetical protein